MKILLITLALALPLTGAYLLVTYLPRPAKSVNITIPDPRAAEHDARLKALEIWAQRQGMKYYPSTALQAKGDQP